MAWFLNIYRKWQKRRIERQFLRCLENEAAGEFLELLLKLISLQLKIDDDFRRNINGFTGRYQFVIGESVTKAAVFTGKDLRVKDSIPDPHVCMVFKDARSLMKYLLPMDRDILGLVLNNEVMTKGNLNYMLKFGYMANHLELALTRKLP